MSTNIPKGKKGEELAVQYVERQGFKIIETNWRYSRLGEIDIIAQDKDALVFIEVKTRTSKAFGHPVEAISEQKLNRMKKLAEIYVNEKNITGYNTFRVDLIAILAGIKTEITHIKDI